MIPITEFASRDVAVFGLKRTGLAAARALKAGGARVSAWDDDEKTRAEAAAVGIPVVDFNQRDWRRFAALVLSPGVPLTHPEPHRIVVLARSVGAPILGDIELYARAVNALSPAQRPKTIGVTGTNGKSTTTALIGHILKEAGRDARVGGNIGEAVLELPPLHAGAVYVLELSSYQLDLTQTLRCDAAVWLNVTPDHLDRHGDMAGYIAAKKRIFANQGAGDWAIVGVDDDASSRICAELMASGSRIVAPISAAKALSKGVTAAGAKIYDNLGAQAEFVADLTEAPNLQGRHNAQNAAAAYAAARAMGVERRVIAHAFRSFPGLPHRLEHAGIVSGVRFVNDSKATNADAAAQALAVFPRVYWIAGGVAKEGGIASLEKFFPRIAGAFLIGEAANDFARTLNSRAPDAVVRKCGDLSAAITAAYEAARASGEPHPVVLFSPACASFDQFRDFEARGDAFKLFVQDIALANAERRA
ncbi:MAG: UDP-N-acetylmuramoyl-L-alanine--D-glutamate ligase [Hyphomonadaceae bacterium]|nr:UDP-N-acetylmuramoyl-L-alanine--D-glutamate ligase [Hyphomonadaceae bacterium]